MSYWRDKSRSVIAAALKEGRAVGLEGKALEKHVSAAYPFGLRENHPYKIWLSEFNFQVKGKTNKPKPKHELEAAGQGSLFEKGSTDA
jgi:hypothetical protein